MKLDRTSAVVEYRLISRFESLRKKLLSASDGKRLEKPLAFWALPNDRRLPLAFLDRPVKDLLSTPFEDLYGTPGVGHKKISSLMTLLARAARDQAEAKVVAEDADADWGLDAPQQHEPAAANGSFDPSTVSEASWVIWREAIAGSEFESQPMGRYAPALERLPRVLWNTPLETYLDFTLAEIRTLKTHGEKRVAAVLEVFHALYVALGTSQSHPALAVRIVPRFALDLEAWMLDVLSREEPFSEQEILDCMVEPLLEQIQIDTDPQIARLARGRLGLEGHERSVRQEASKLGLTRARVYQLLSDVGVVMSVRWPAGQYLIAELCDKVSAQLPHSHQHLLLQSVADLFFPDHRRRTAVDDLVANGDSGELNGSEVETSNSDLEVDIPTRRRAG